ncbi:MAG: endonuclease/exonuclease/phosphatase family protein [Acidimicrobiia bacterium]
MFDTPEPRRTLKVLLGALVFTLGAQSLRFFFGSITWYLRDTVGIPTLRLVPIALAPFVAAVILPLLVRRLTLRGSLWTGTWILVLARVLNQAVDSPAVDLWTAGLATFAFVGLLPLLLSLGRPALVGGILLGLALDSAIKGMRLSLDLAYQPGVPALLAVFALAAATVYLLWLALPLEHQGVTWGSGWTLIGLGPFLFFEFLVLQNQGWTSEVGAVAGPQTQLRIAVLNVVALIAVGWLERNRTAGLAALVVMVGAAVAAGASPVVFNSFALLAVPAGALVWASLAPDTDRGGVGASAVYLTLGMLLFVFMGLAYYLPMDIDFGFGQQEARLAFAAVLGLFGLAGVVSLPATRPGATRQTWAFAALASVLPLLGLAFSGGQARTLEILPEGTIRAMSYNIHSAYDTSGRFNIEGIARVIEDSGATVVGLQEVPRGRLISGVTDELTLLADRLGFEYFAFFGTTDPTWGNAILSRYPITGVERVYLPQVGTPLRRGYLAATLMVDGKPLLFISTHLQHVNDPAVHDDDPEADLYPVHTEQIATILEEWDGREPAVLVGDFNARPEWRQITELLSAGWVDAWAEAGRGEGFTSNAADPRFRIDYIFHTADLPATDAGVIQSQASDHFAVVADLVRR